MPAEWVPLHIPSAVPATKTESGSMDRKLAGKTAILGLNDYLIINFGFEMSRAEQA